MQTLISIIEVILVVVPALLVVAFTTVAERKTMASMQRRLGPNIVGYYGLLQAFADALKLLLKECVSPTQANLVLFFLGPLITLIFSLLGYAVIPYGPGLTIGDMPLGILYMLAVSSLSTYGILLAGWSANSKYAFLGSLRSTAQLISYELILSSAILLVLLLSGNLNLTGNIESQKAVYFLLPLLPVALIFFIGAIAETNRAPFDLAEAESELVSGFMTEHSAAIFVFFFLAEYASIVLICIFTSILFLGGYLNIISLDFAKDTISLYNIDYLWQTYEYNILILENYYFNFLLWGYHNNISLICDYLLLDNNAGNFHISYLNDLYSNVNSIDNVSINNEHDSVSSDSSFLIVLLQGLNTSINLGLKGCIMIFTFIWVRASFPRIRFDQLMSYCWTILLPIIIAFIVVLPCFVSGLSLITANFLVL